MFKLCFLLFFVQVVLIGCEETHPNTFFIETETENETTIEIETEIETSIKETDSFITTEIENETNTEFETETKLPNLKFILWDKFGEPVEASISPSWEKQRFGEVKDKKCIYLYYLKQREIGMYFSLKTGRPEDCIDENEKINYKTDLFFYKDKYCSSFAYYPTGGLISFIENVFYYTYGTSSVLLDVYYKKTTEGECKEYINNNNYGFFYKWGKVPDEILKMLPDFPYSITGQY
jgi:hypothetical protein